MQKGSRLNFKTESTPTKDPRMLSCAVDLQLSLPTGEYRHVYLRGREALVALTKTLLTQFAALVTSGRMAISFANQDVVA